MGVVESAQLVQGPCIIGNRGIRRILGRRSPPSHCQSERIESAHEANRRVSLRSSANEAGRGQAAYRCYCLRRVPSPTGAPHRAGRRRAGSGEPADRTGSGSDRKMQQDPWSRRLDWWIGHQPGGTIRGDGRLKNLFRIFGRAFGSGSSGAHPLFCDHIIPFGRSGRVRSPGAGGSSQEVYTARAGSMTVCTARQSVLCFIVPRLCLPGSLSLLPVPTARRQDRGFSGGLPVGPGFVWVALSAWFALYVWSALYAWFAQLHGSLAAPEDRSPTLLSSRRQSPLQLAVSTVSPAGFPRGCKEQLIPPQQCA